MRKFLIYGLTDPRTGQVRYIGKSTTGMQRPLQHRSDTVTHRGRWIVGLERRGLQYGIVVLYRCKRAEDLADAECEFIALYRKLGVRLTNCTDGGDGTLGYRHTKESRASIGEKNRIRYTGRKLTPEWKAKVVAALIGRPVSAETRERMRLAHLGQVNTPEQIARWRLSRFGEI